MSDSSDAPNGVNDQFLSQTDRGSPPFLHLHSGYTRPTEGVNELTVHELPLHLYIEIE